MDAERAYPQRLGGESSRCRPTCSNRKKNSRRAPRRSNLIAAQVRRELVMAYRRRVSGSVGIGLIGELARSCCCATPPRIRRAFEAH